MEIKRERYRKQQVENIHNGFIRVVIGIRRCGNACSP